MAPCMSAWVGSVSTWRARKRRAWRILEQVLWVVLDRRKECKLDLGWSNMVIFFTIFNHLSTSFNIFQLEAVLPSSQLPTGRIQRDPAMPGLGLASHHRCSDHRGPQRLRPFGAALGRQRQGGEVLARGGHRDRQGRDLRGALAVGRDFGPDDTQTETQTMEPFANW